MQPTLSNKDRRDRLNAELAEESGEARLQLMRDRVTAESAEVRLQRMRDRQAAKSADRLGFNR